MKPATRPAGTRIRKPREKGADRSGKGGNSSVEAAPRARTAGLPLARAAYALSAHDPRELPAPGRPEIAFAGRSNAGKSSVINTLTGRRRLAFVSKTPGRTQLINFYRVGERSFLTDLPGYGYARVPAAARAGWETLLGGYLKTRGPLRGLALVMDARHPLTELDRRMLAWFA